MTKGVATFGAGCFWQVEVEFRNVPGVLDTAVGYMGGTLPEPSYRDVCTDRTGHAEVVQVEHDAARVTYEELLDVFWRIHNPTTRNRQGWLFCADGAQRAASSSATRASPPISYARSNPRGLHRSASSG